MMEFQEVRLLADGLMLPEGPVAMDDGSVIFVQVRGGLLSRVDADGKSSTVAELGGGPNGAAIGPDGALYVCNNGGMTNKSPIPGCIQRVDVATGEYDVLYDSCDGSPLEAPNDLVFDSAGHFWFTDNRKGAIFYASADGKSITQPVEGLSSPNGIGLSPDESLLYWSQTKTRQVLRRRVSSPGELVPSPGYDARAVIRGGGVDPFILLVGLPGARELDSLAIEANGSVCVGSLVEGGITVISPDGASVELIQAPAEFADGAVTNICFGGEDMQTAYVTLAEHGRLISCRWPRPGLRLAY
jgi:gluconolactonase